MPTVNEAVICAELDDELVLLNLETGIYFGLNPVGARIWALLSDGADEEAILGALQSEYDADPDELRVDLIDFLDQLNTKGLLVSGSNQP